MNSMLQPLTLTHFKNELDKPICRMFDRLTIKFSLVLMLVIIILISNKAQASMPAVTSIDESSNQAHLHVSSFKKINEYAQKINHYSASVTALLVLPGMAPESPELNTSGQNLVLQNELNNPSLQATNDLPVTVLDSNAFANTSAQFGLQFLSPTQGNYSLSPFGLSSVLAMLASASAGPSSKQIYEIYGANESASAILQKQLPEYLQGTKNYQLSKGNEFFVQNKILINQSISQQMNPEYKQLAQDKFLASQLLFDASASDAEKKINQQIENETQGKIQELLPKNSISASTQVLFSNTFQFKGLWEKAFNVQNTKMLDFFSEEGKSIGLIKTMTQELDLQQATINGYTAYDLPYQGGQFLFRIIPLPEGKKLAELTQSLSSHQWSDWSANMKTQHCILSMPKFKMPANSNSVAEKLQLLGMKEIFSTHADFSPMLGASGKSHHLDNIFHAVALEVDENGTELAAATVATVKSKSLKASCTINRPFVFAVIDKQFSTPFVLGLIQQPQSADSFSQ